MATTIRDVAKLAEVSVATVSRVLGGSRLVSFETQARVLSAISRLNYRPNTHASELTRNRGNRQVSELLGIRNRTSKEALDSTISAKTAFAETDESRAVDIQYLRLRRVVDALTRILDQWKGSRER